MTHGYSAIVPVLESELGPLLPTHLHRRGCHRPREIQGLSNDNSLDVVMWSFQVCSWQLDFEADTSERINSLRLLPATRYLVL